MRRVLGLGLALATLVSGCTGSGDPPPTTATFSPSTTRQPATTTTVRDRCPDVFCVVYYLRPEATWSDGSPVVAADFVHTLSLALDPLRADPDNPGYRMISGHEVIDPKTILFSFPEPFVAWRTLFDVVLPAHGDPDVPGPTSGPFVLEDWVEGDRIVLRRNPEFVGFDGPEGDIEELWFVYPDGVRGMIGQMRRGEVDVINPRPLDWLVSELGDLEETRVQLGPGPFWEQIALNFDDPLLSQEWVREVIAMAIDRETVLDATVRTVDSDAGSLGSTIFMQGSARYQHHFAFDYDPSQAEQILAARSCERGSDGVQVCQGRRMSFLWATTAGDSWREGQLALAVESLGEIGIEIVPRLLVPSELFARRFFFGDSGVWQMLSFSWKASADPFLGESIYRCEGDGPHGMGELNVNRFCDGEVETILDRTQSVLDPNERARAYNEVDALYLRHASVIPLYQKPVMLAWSSALRGPQLNPAATDMWNVGSWSGKEVVTVALGSEPSTVMSLGPLDDSGAMIRDALYLGAFGVDPEWEFVPELALGAEAFMRGE